MDDALALKQAVKSDLNQAGCLAYPLPRGKDAQITRSQTAGNAFSRSFTGLFELRFFLTIP